jgi:hypothetical protein
MRTDGIKVGKSTANIPKKQKNKTSTPAPLNPQALPLPSPPLNQETCSPKHKITNKINN